jgi:hypothetical protein
VNAAQRAYLPRLVAEAAPDVRRLLNQSLEVGLLLFEMLLPSQRRRSALAV